MSYNDFENCGTLTNPMTGVVDKSIRLRSGDMEDKCYVNRPRRAAPPVDVSGDVCN